MNRIVKEELLPEFLKELSPILERLKEAVSSPGDGDGNGDGDGDEGRLQYLYLQIQMHVSWVFGCFALQAVRIAKANGVFMHLCSSFLSEMTHVFPTQVRERVEQGEDGSAVAAISQFAASIIADGSSPEGSLLEMQAKTLKSLHSIPSGHRPARSLS
jgi:hypothetical protein